MVNLTTVPCTLLSMSSCWKGYQHGECHHSTTHCCQCQAVGKATNMVNVTTCTVPLTVVSVKLLERAVMVNVTTVPLTLLSGTGGGYACVFVTSIVCLWAEYRHQHEGTQKRYTHILLPRIGYKVINLTCLFFLVFFLFFLELSEHTEIF